MTPSAAASLAEPNRQSPLAAVFLVIRVVRGIGIFQIVIAAGFLLSQSPSILWLAAAVVLIGLIALAMGLASWWRYTFAIVGGELQVQQGVFAQQTLTVPLDRVQSVSIEQKLLHRIVNLVQVSLDTAGTSAAEFTIDAIDRDVAVALQSAAADYRRDSQAQASVVDASGEATPPPPAAPDKVLLQHDPSRIIKIALTQMPFSGLAVLAPLFAFGEDIVGWFPGEPPEVDFSVGQWLLWFVPLAILAVVLVSVLLNVIRVFLSDWNLTITQTEAGLRRDAGLLSTTSVASSLPRVQRFDVAQGVIQRLVGLHTTKLHSIGDADFTVPGCDVGQVENLRELALDGSDGVPHLGRRVSPLETFKATRNISILMVPFGVGMSFVIGWWAVLFAVPILLTYATTKRSARLRRWGIDEDAVANRGELFGWSSQEALLRKTNAVSVTQSLFERKRGLATVHVKLAGGILSGGTISIGMISHAEALAVRDRALYVAETDRRVFM